MSSARGKCAGALSWAALLLGFLHTGCSLENYGLDYTRVELSAKRSDGSAASQLTTPLCVTLPVLMGSVVEERRLIEDSLGVSIRASAEQVELRFFGAATASEARSVTIDDLDGGYRAQIELESREGSAVTVVLSSPCSEL